MITGHVFTVRTPTTTECVTMSLWGAPTRQLAITTPRLLKMTVLACMLQQDMDATERA